VGAIVRVGVSVGVEVGVAVGVGDGGRVGVIVGVGDGVSVGVAVGVGDSIGVKLSVGSSVELSAGDGSVVCGRRVFAATDRVRVIDSTEVGVAVCIVPPTGKGIAVWVSNDRSTERVGNCGDSPGTMVGNAVADTVIGKEAVVALCAFSSAPECGNDSARLDIPSIARERRRLSTTGQDHHTRPPQTTAHSVMPISPLVRRPFQPLRRTLKTSGPKRWLPRHAVTSRRGPISNKPGRITRSTTRQRSSSPATGLAFLPFTRRRE
jgi:hypothetical protein